LACGDPIELAMLRRIQTKPASAEEGDRVRLGHGEALGDSDHAGVGDDQPKANASLA
jgi:hypothetical protein